MASGGGSGGGLGQWLASWLGLAIGAGSVMLYSPLLYRVCRKRSANGLSPATWVLKSATYSVSFLYCWLHAYPLAAYVEMVSIGGEIRARRARPKLLPRPSLLPHRHCCGYPASRLSLLPRRH
jgi:hypothetical protein